VTQIRKFVELDVACHDTQGFNCGLTLLDDFLRKKAATHRELRISKTMVLPALIPSSGGKYPIESFFTITQTVVKRDTLPAALAKPLPPYPVPASMIPCLAVAKQSQGQGLGKITVVRSLELLLKASKTVPSYAVIIKPYDERAEKLYKSFDFLELNEEFLWLPMATVEDLFSKQ